MTTYILELNNGMDPNFEAIGQNVTSLLGKPFLATSFL